MAQVGYAGRSRLAGAVLRPRREDLRPSAPPAGRGTLGVATPTGGDEHRRRGRHVTDRRREEESAPPASGVGGPVVTAPRVPAPAHVLVVGADPAVVDAVRRAFPDAGGEVRTVAGLAEVVAEVVGRGRPETELALVDLDLPGLDAVEVTRLLGASTDATVLVTTRTRGPDRILAALDAGAHDFLAHPVDPHELRLRATALRPADGRGSGLPGAHGPSDPGVSPSELLHELNNVLGAMRFTVFLSRPHPVREHGTGPAGDEHESTPLGAAEAAARMDALVTRASALVVELARRIAAPR